MARRSAKKKAGLPAAPRRPVAPPPVRSTGRLPQDRRRLYLWGGAGLAAVAVVAVVLALVLSGGSSKPAAIPWSKLGQLQTGPPPWSNDLGQLQARLSYLNLHALSSEGTVLHIHQHLDLYVNGKKVAVPALIGIDDNAFITEIHIHDASGVIHVESPTKRSFTLGQLFGEWGVKLTASCVGRYCGHLRWWVNGKRMTGDPAQLTLRAHQEIVVAEGPPPLVVPKSYAFPAGE